MRFAVPDAVIGVVLEGIVSLLILCAVMFYAHKKGLDFVAKRITIEQERLNATLTQRISALEAEVTALKAGNDAMALSLNEKQKAYDATVALNLALQAKNADHEKEIVDLKAQVLQERQQAQFAVINDRLARQDAAAHAAPAVHGG